MPRVTPLDPFLERGKAIQAWISGGMAFKGITQTDLSARTGIPKATVSYRIRNPETLREEEKWKIQKVIGSPKEVGERILSIT